MVKLGSVWLDKARMPRAALEGDLEAEVCIIGGGVTGASAAYHLGKLGVDFALIEQGRLGSGSTGMSTASLVPGVELDLWQAIKKFGKRKALLLWNSTRDSISEIERTVKKEKLKCEFKRADSYYIARKKAHLEFIRKECRLADRFGFRAEFLDKRRLLDQINVPKSYGGMVYRGNAELHPVKFVEGLVGKVRTDSVFENTKATRISKNGNGFKVATPHGSIKCKKLLLATESYTNGLGLGGMPVLNVVDRVIATERMPRRAMGRTLFAGKQAWGSELLYNFFRTTADNRILMTGRDVAAGKRGVKITAKEVQSLKSALVSYFPDLKEIKIDRAWSGAISISLRLMPYIGMDTKIANLFYSVGYGGHGMVFGFLGGKMMAYMSAGNSAGLPEELAALLAPKKEPFVETIAKVALAKAYINLHETILAPWS